MLKEIGCYRELGEGYERCPSMRGAASTCARPDEDKVVAYLREGVVLLCSPGSEYDVLDPHDRTLLSYNYLTDGVWTWRADLAHYVHKYHLALDCDFVSHMKANHWRVPPESSMDPRVFSEC